MSALRDLVGIAPIPVLTAIGGAFLGAGFGLVSAARQKGNDAEKAKWTKLLERRTEQLGTLYMPMRTQRAQASAYRAQLPSHEPDGVTPWRMVRHAGTLGVAYRALKAEEITVDELPLGFSAAQLEAAARIIEIGDSVCELIDGSAGLFNDGAPAEPYLDYQQHHRGLQLAWHTGQDQTEENEDPFDVAVVQQLERDIEAVHSQHQRLLGSGPATSGAGLGWGLAAAGVLVLALVGAAEILDDGPGFGLVTNVDEVRCGEVSTGTDGALLVAGKVVAGGSDVEFVDSCD